jgi:Uma2 family endonuclease
MAVGTPPAGTIPERFTAERYFALVDEGVLAPDDPVELLEGVIVSMPPKNPPHAVATGLVGDALRAALGTRAAVREQNPLVASRLSVPEPDIAVVAGAHGDYMHAHPTTALLLVEVADSSLGQDRLTKAGIYAAAGIPEYWIVNLRDECVEIMRDPDTEARFFRSRRVAGRGEEIFLVAVPDAHVAVDDLLPAASPD